MALVDQLTQQKEFCDTSVIALSYCSAQKLKEMTFSGLTLEELAQQTNGFTRVFSPLTKSYDQKQNMWTSLHATDVFTNTYEERPEGGTFLNFCFTIAGLSESQDKYVLRSSFMQKVATTMSCAKAVLLYKRLSCETDYFVRSGDRN